MVDNSDIPMNRIQARVFAANEQVANQLREAATLLVLQSANPFRVNAYRQAADTVEQLPHDIRRLTETDGSAGLIALPHIGQGIAAAILEIVTTGRWTRLDRLRGELEPEQLFQRVPGIGPEMAARIHDVLHIDNLEALESAAHDGTLATVPGMGPRRSAMVRDSLSALLGRPRRYQHQLAGAPSVQVLLDVDREYRRKAAGGELPTIAPRRFNPDGVSWLPVLHTQRGDWHFTVLFSNTARAHELERTSDWVVIYAYDDAHLEQQCTVVTETRGALRGRRVVRGREQECELLSPDV